MEEKIEIMQHNLKIIRTLLGWNCREFAEKLGCTKQLISLLENGKHKMSQIQYMAIMYLLHTEYANGRIEPKKWDLLRFILSQL